MWGDPCRAQPTRAAPAGAPKTRRLRCACVLFPPRRRPTGARTALRSVARPPSAAARPPSKAKRLKVKTPLHEIAVKRKLASGQKRIEPGAHAFVNSTLTAGCIRENRFAYGELASGQSVYAYVLNNPLRFTDPTGESATIALEWCLVNPGACGSSVVAGVGGAGIAAAIVGAGAIIYPPALCENEDAERCKNVLKECREICTDIYVENPNGLPGTGSDMPGRIRRCIRECMEGQGCNNF